MKLSARIFYGKIENNKIKLYDDFRFNELKESLNGKDIELSIGETGRKRSNQQNRWLWGVAYKIIGNYIGERDLEKVHELCKQEYPQRDKLEINLKDGTTKTVEFPTSTAKMNTLEFCNYMEWIIQWGAEFLGCQIPEPNE